MLEDRQVDGVRLDDPDADELVQEVPDDRVSAGHVVVELLAGHARDAAEDDQKRLARRLGGSDALSQVVVDPVLRCLEGLTVVADLGVSVLGQDRRGQQEQGKP